MPLAALGCPGTRQLQLFKPNLNRFSYITRRLLPLALNPIAPKQTESRNTDDAEAFHPS